MPTFPSYTEVRLRNDPSTVGLATGNEKTLPNGRVVVEVQVIGKGMKQYPADQLETIQNDNGVVEDLRQGKFLSPNALRTVLIHIQLSGRLADMIYSMEATNTDFYAYQFKPVLKLINSPSGGLLIADEVGLGKTIEAGLIWTEIKARYDAKNLLVVCPKMLSEKWRAELLNKFDVRANICNAKEMLSTLNDKSLLRKGGAYICAMQSIRPPKDWKEEEPESKLLNHIALAKKLDSLSEGEPVFDLLIVDEAHHMRNSQTQLHELGSLLRTLAHHVVFLSATPIHLKNKDLLSQLSLLDPGSFAMSSEKQALRSFENLLDANKPIMDARNLIEAGDNNRDEVKNVLTDALTEDLLSDSRLLRNCISQLSSQSGKMNNEERASILGKLDQANLLSNVVTRTRRRDVQELRVVRRIYPLKTNMCGTEREFYDKVSFAVRKYADQKDVVQNFLLASPQRMMASCMSAALAHWRKDGSFESEDQLSDIDTADLDEKPLISFMRQETSSFKISDLQQNDTKYAELLAVLKGDYETEKTVLFSSFKPTLRYLETRLNEDNIDTIMISGDVKDRNALLQEFENRTGQIVLLSSEVGSEGLDLQFCRTLINYDLPWNPMRVEQRIGRIDRVGQASEFISVLNFLHENTIDQRIWDRLYSRLNLCEQALGGFEDILGEELRGFEKDLLAGLSPEEQNKQIDQRAQAIANKKQVHEDLEQEATGLMAHGDYILNKVSQAHEFKRWMTGDDIRQYLNGFLNEYFSRSNITKVADKEHSYKVYLDNQARQALADYCKIKQLSQATSLHLQSETNIYFGKGPARKSASFETITQTHPFVRFATHHISENRQTALTPAIAATLDSSELSFALEVGTFLITVQQWTITGLSSIEKLAYAGQNSETGAKIEPELAEMIANKVANVGELNHITPPNLDRLSQSCEAMFDQLLIDFEVFKSEYIDELYDRANFQKRNLDSHLVYQKEITDSAIEKLFERASLEPNPKKKQNLQSLMQAQRGKLTKLEEKYSYRKSEIDKSLELTEEATNVTAIYVQIH